MVSKSGAGIFQLKERRAWGGRGRGGYRREATWKVETGRRGRLKEKRTVKRKLKGSRGTGGRKQLKYVTKSADFTFLLNQRKD